ncbi:MAG: hypothetical protein NZ750_07675 [Anaerolineae bacterium]|nr:hypothetical protein [Anaerolineae bacterium]MDW8172228.1 hypothetical protein [Anaerolineae bacterium]
MTRTILPSRGWLAAYLLVLALVGALYVPTYRYSFPYIDHTDEPQMNLGARWWIEHDSAKGMLFHAYPPATIALNFVALKFLPHDHPNDVLLPLRLLTIFFGLGVVSLVMLLAREVVGDWGGLAAGVLWGFLPDNVARAAPVIANTYLTFFTLLALWLALVARRRPGDGWRTAAHYALMVAITFKTQAIFVFPALLSIGLLDWQAKEKRPALLRWLYAMFWRWLLFMIWLLVFYPTLQANDIPHWAAPIGQLGLPTPQLLLDNFAAATDDWASPLNWLLTLGPLLGLLVAPLRWRIATLPVLALMASVLAWWIGVSFFGQQDARQFITMNAMLAVLRGASLGLAIHLVIGLLDNFSPRLQRWAVPISGALMLVFLLKLMQPFVVESQRISYDMSRRDHRADLAEYAAASLESGGYVGNWNYHKVFNPDWGGYRGQTIFRLVEQAEYESRDVDEWRAQGASFALIPYVSRRDYATSRDAAQTVLLKQFPPREDRRGPTTSVVWLWPMQPLADQISLGGVTLLGYRLEDADELRLRLFWRSEQPTAVPHTLFLHLLDAEGNIVAQHDGPPTLPGRPTTTWDDPDEIIMSHVLALSLPQSRARLVAGFYDPQSGARLRAVDGTDSWEVLRWTP